MNNSVNAVDLSNIENLPSDIVNYVDSSRKIFDKVIGKINRSGYVGQRTIDNMITPTAFVNNQKREFKGFLHEFTEKLNSCYFVGYHATRVLSAADIYNMGLLAFESKDDYFLQIIEPSLMQINNTEEFKTRAKERVDRIINESSRIRQVNFFAPGTVIDDDQDYVYHNYAANIGGEIATRAFENEKDVINHLRKTGRPVLVKFCFSYADITEKYPIPKEEITLKILRWILAKQLMRFPYKIEISGAVRHSIPPENIIKVSPIK